MSHVTGTRARPHQDAVKNAVQARRHKTVGQNNSGNSSGTQVPTQAEILKAKLCEFYMNTTNVERILPIVNRTSPVSLRLLDHFVVNYAVTHSVAYPLNDKEIFDVHKSYDAQLNKYHKILFDPFRRGEKVTLECADRDPPIRIETTLAQLCFFKWCIEYKVLEYVEKHIHAITDNMKQHLATKVTFDASVDTSGSSGKRRSSRRRTSSGDLAARRLAMNGRSRFIVTFD